jgi:hypothetical protein
MIFSLFLTISSHDGVSELLIRIRFRFERRFMVGVKNSCSLFYWQGPFTRGRGLLDRPNIMVHLFACFVTKMFACFSSPSSILPNLVHLCVFDHRLGHELSSK